MNKSLIKVGMIVTCKKTVEAYGSGYPKGSSRCFLEPGDIARVACTDFVCVDFFKPGIIHNPHHWQERGETPWRAALDHDNIHKLSIQDLAGYPYHSLTIEVSDPLAENKALIGETFPYQFADTLASGHSPSQVVIRLLHLISPWQIYWMGIKFGQEKILQWYTLENEMPC